MSEMERYYLFCVCIFVCLDSDSHDNPKTESHRKFVLVRRFLSFQCVGLELIMNYLESELPGIKNVDIFFY